MSRVALITAQPRVAATGAAATHRLAGGGNRKGYFQLGQHWRAGIATLPRFSALIGVDENGFTGGAIPTTSNVIWAPSSKADLAALAAHYWRNAPITIEEGDEDSGVFTTRLTGNVADAAVQDNRLLLTIADLSKGLDRPIVTGRFAGTGGVEGAAEAKERIRRRSWGRVFNIEGMILDKANNIYEFGDPAFPLLSFDALRDKGRDASPAPTILPWQGSVAATLAALAASAPAQGSGVVAPSIACAKWWTQPAGPLTANLRGEVGTGYVETAAEIAVRVLAAVGGPAITNASAASGWRAGVAGLHVEEGDTIATALDRLLLGVSLLWALNPAGTVTIREFTFEAPVETLRSDNASRLRTFAPVKTRRIGYQRSHRKHSDGEIAASLTTVGMRLAPSADGFTFTDGAPDGVVASITFTATSADPAETINWTTSPAVTLTGAGNSRTLSVANLGAHRQVIVTATGANTGHAASAGASRLDRSTAAAGATKGRNLAANGDAEDGTTLPWASEPLSSAGAGGTLSNTAVSPTSGSRSFLLTKTAAGDGVGVNMPAVKTQPGARFVIRLRYAGNSATAAGLFLQMREKATAPAGDYVTHVQRTSVTNLAADLPIGTAAGELRYEYTVPAGIYFFSPSVSNYIGGPTQLRFEIEYYELTDTELDADVTYEIVGPSAVDVASKSDGTYQTGVLAAAAQSFVVLTRAGDVTATLTYSVIVKSGSGTASIAISNGKAVLTPLSLPETTIFEISALLGGAVRDKHVLTMNQKRPPPASGSTGSGSGTASSASITGTSASTTPTTLSSIITAKAGATGQVECSAGVGYVRQEGTSGIAVGAAVWRWRVVGGTFVDVAAANVGSTASTIAGEPQEEGYVGCSMTKTGLTNGTDYEFQLMGYRNSGSGTLSFYGSGGSSATCTGA